MGTDMILEKLPLDGITIRQIEAETGYGKNTITRYLRDNHFEVLGKMRVSTQFVNVYRRADVKAILNGTAIKTRVPTMIETSWFNKQAVKFNTRVGL
jgi:hypothetical protein